MKIAKHSLDACPAANTDRGHEEEEKEKDLDTGGRMKRRREEKEEMDKSKIPRLYQLEMLEMAKEKNAIAYLDTGAGKTFIAVLLLRHRLERRHLEADAVRRKHRQDRSPSGMGTSLGEDGNGDRGRYRDRCPFDDPNNFFSVFLAPRVSLVHQQADVLARHIHAKVVSFTGEAVEHWWNDPLRGREELSRVDVAVMTPQVLVNALNHALIPGIHTIDTLIIDEAHHCRKKDPCNVVMEFYRNASDKSNLPRVLGLTAAPAMVSKKINPETLTKSLHELETNMEATVVTVSDRTELENIVPPAKIEVKHYKSNELPETMKVIDAALLDGIAALEEVVDEITTIWKEDLQETIGYSGTEAAVSVAFGPGAPRFKATRLKDVLRSVSGILHDVGFYSSAYSFLAALQWLFKGAPDPRSMYSGSPCHPRPFARNFVSPSPNKRRSLGESDASDSPTLLPSYQDLGKYLHELDDNLVVDSGRKGLKDVSTVGEGAHPSEKLGWTVKKVIIEVLTAYINVILPTEPRSMQHDQESMAALMDSASLPKRSGNSSHAAWEHCNAREVQVDGGSIVFSEDEGGICSERVVMLMEKLLKSLKSASTLLDPQASDLSGAVASSKDLAETESHHPLPLLSQKACSLISILVGYRPDQIPSSKIEPWSAIIFVKQRLAALAVADLLSTVPSLKSWLRVSAFMGSGPTFGGSGFDGAAQKSILAQFKSGRLNLLVSTSVAEEGIDVRSCSLVIRFDPATSAQSFHQSRGRARVIGSRMIALLQEGDELAKQMLEQHTNYATELRAVVRETCNAYSDDQSVEEKDPETKCDDRVTELEEIMDDSSLVAEDDASVDIPFVVQSTGAQVSMKSSLSLIMSYINSLPADQFTFLRPIYRFESMDNGMVRALVKLPSSSPVSAAYSQLCRTRSQAKASAALEMCRQLYQVGALNDHLLPTTTRDRLKKFEASLQKRFKANSPAQQAKTVRERKGLESIEICDGVPDALKHNLPTRQLLQQYRSEDTVHKSLGIGFEWLLHQFPIDILGIQRQLERDVSTSNDIREQWRQDLDSDDKFLCPLDSSLAKSRNIEGDYTIHYYTWHSIGPLALVLKEKMEKPQKSSFRKHLFESFDYVGTTTVTQKNLQKLLKCSTVLQGMFKSNFQANRHMEITEDVSSYIIAPIKKDSRHIDWTMICRILILRENLDEAFSVFSSRRMLSKRSKSTSPDLSIKQGDSDAADAEDKSPPSKSNDDTEETIDFRSIKNRRKEIITALNVMQRRIQSIHPAMSDLCLDDHVLVTPYNKIQYVYNGVRNDLTLDSPFPSSTDIPRFGKEEDVCANSDGIASLANGDAVAGAGYPPGFTYGDYYIHRWRIAGLSQSQPLISAKHASASRRILRRHFDRTSTVESEAIQRRASSLCEEKKDIDRHVTTVESLRSNDVDEGTRDSDWGQHSNAQNDSLFSLELVPELCCLHPVPVSMWRAVERFNESIWIFQGALLAQEVIATLESKGVPSSDCPSSALILQALTATSASSSKNYETLETLGDSFLKYAVSVDLFLSNPSWHEGQLTESKDVLISNRRLVKVALDLNLDTKLRISPRKRFHDLEHNAGPQLRLNKILADVVEALIGAFLFESGESAALRLLRVLGFITFLDWNEAIPKFCSSSKQHPVDSDLLDHVETALRYRFRYPSLVQQALTHGSYFGHQSYQRLEFLGDTILDMGLLREVIFHTSNTTPSEIHDTRSAAGNSERLALVSIRHCLHQLIFHSSPVLSRQIDALLCKLDIERERFSRKYLPAVSDNISERYPQEDCYHSSNKRPLHSLSEYHRRRPRSSLSNHDIDRQVWDDILRKHSFGIPGCAAPKVLCDIVEALVGAVWLDSGGDLEKTWQCIVVLTTPIPGVRGEPVAINPVRLLYELAAKQGCKVQYKPSYGGRNGQALTKVSVSWNDEIIAEVPASFSRIAAERHAATIALEKLSLS